MSIGIRCTFKFQLIIELFKLWWMPLIDTLWELICHDPILKIMTGAKLFFLVWQALINLQPSSKTNSGLIWRNKFFCIFFNYQNNNMHDKHVSHSYRKYTLESKEITVLDLKSMLTLLFKIDTRRIHSRFNWHKANNMKYNKRQSESQVGK